MLVVSEVSNRARPIVDKNFKLLLEVVLVDFVVQVQLMNLVDGGRLRVIACHPTSDAVDHIFDLRNEYCDGPQSRYNEPETVDHRRLTRTSKIRPLLRFSMILGLEMTTELMASLIGIFLVFIFYGVLIAREMHDGRSFSDILNRGLFADRYEDSFRNS